MQSLSNNYLMELASQLAFLSAFLGGFAATFLVTFLVADSSKRITNWIVSSTALSSCGFVIGVISFVMVGTIVHPDSPSLKSEEVINTARVISSLAFFVSILMLLASIGLSGWLRSKKVGLVTSSISLMALVIIVWAILGFK